MTKKHVVYTEKDLLQPTGTITFDGETHKLDKSSISILDDHRGYYPLSSGYDWATCMGEVTVNNKVSKFGINVTDFYKNIDRINCNENGFWLEGEFHQLPEVHFERLDNSWHISDREGKVSLIFTKNNSYTEKRKGVLKIDYEFAIGSTSGKIITSDNVVINLEEMFGLGEKRITKTLFGKEK